MAEAALSTDAVGRAPPETIAPSNNICAFFAHWVARAPDRPAIVFPRREGAGVAYEQVSFQELSDDADRLAHALRRLGVAKGDRVLIMIPMSRPLYALLIAVMKLNATAVFLDPWVKLEQMGKAAELVQPKVFAGIPKAHWLRLLSRPFRRIPLKLVALGQTPFARLLGRSVEGLLRGPHQPLEAVPGQLDDTALITFTTGSTGTPKGSNRTQFFLNAQGVALAHHLPRQPGDVDMPALPVFVLNNLGVGVPSVLPLVDFTRISEVEPGLILQQIADWKVTTIGGSPAYLAPIARHCLEQGRTLDTVRGVVAGGAPVTPELLRQLQQVCPQARGNIEVLYGSTEAEPVAKIEADEVLGETAARTEAGRGNCVGRPVPDIALKVVVANPEPWQLDERGWAGVELPQGQVGELLVTGDHVQKEYFRNPEAVAANKVTAPDGVVWHRMGDLGYLDEQGRIWLVGRVNNAVRAGERWLYPIQVEARVDQVEGVRRSALVALDGQPLLVVVPAGEGDDALRERVLGACREADWPLSQVRFRAEIPLDPRHNAKVDHRALVAALAEESP